MSDFDMKGLEGKIEKSKSMLKEDLSTVRAGRANAALVDKVMVEYYGTPTPLKALANISVPEPRTLQSNYFTIVYRVDSDVCDVDSLFDFRNALRIEW